MSSQVSSQEPRRFLSTTELEALKLWAVALALALFGAGIYLIGLGVMSAFPSGQ